MLLSPILGIFPLFTQLYRMATPKLVSKKLNKVPYETTFPKLNFPQIHRKALKCSSSLHLQQN